MRKSVAVFVVLFTGCGGAENSGKPSMLGQEDKQDQSVVKPDGESRYLALGDSYTIGEGVSPSERWPVQLAELLRTEGIELGDPTIVARTGWTTGDLVQGIDHAGVTGPYELVTLLIGVNNQYRGRSMDEYRAELTTLLERAVRLAGDRPRRVIVLSIPDWGVTPFAAGRDQVAIAGAIDQFNAIQREETAKVGANFVEITIASRRAAADESLLAPDGLHPSGKMYAEWAAAALPVARDALSRP